MGRRETRRSCQRSALTLKADAGRIGKFAIHAWDEIVFVQVLKKTDRPETMNLRVGMHPIPVAVLVDVLTNLNSGPHVAEIIARVAGAIQNRQSEALLFGQGLSIDGVNVEKKKDSLRMFGLQTSA